MGGKPKKSKLDVNREFFFKTCRRLITDFGLSNWDVTYKVGVEDQSNDAECAFNAHVLMAEIRLSETAGPVVGGNRNDIIGLAMHEVLHLLFGELHDMMPGELMESANKRVHASINRLVNFLMK